MKQFFAALAMLSALLIVDANACDKPAPKAEVEIQLKLLRVEVSYMSGVRAKAYLDTVNAEPPATDLKSETILIGVGNGRVSVAAVDGDNVCTGDFLVFAPELHRRALLAADRSSI